MPGETPFYAPEELRALGCVSVGRQAQVSRLARFYGFQGRLGDHIRIDDFVILKGRVDIGCFVHISSYCLLGGTAGTVTFGDFSTTAAYVGIYTASDDYSSPLLTNSVVPDRSQTWHHGGRFCRQGRGYRGTLRRVAQGDDRGLRDDWRLVHHQRELRARVRLRDGKWPAADCWPA